MRLRSFRLTRTVSPPEPASALAAMTLLVSGVGVLTLMLIARVFDFSLSPLMWYLTRSAGVALYVTLWLTMLLGLGITTRALDRFGGRGLIFSIHSFATQLSVGFLAFHLVTLVANPYDAYSVRMIFVPFQSGWREPWTGLGVIGAYLFVVVAGSYSIRRFTGFRFWRATHYLSIPLYAAAFAHAIGSGSASAPLWAKGLYTLSALPIVWMIGVRVTSGGRRTNVQLPGEGPLYDRMSGPRPSAAPGTAQGD